MRRSLAGPPLSAAASRPGRGPGVRPTPVPLRGSPGRAVRRLRPAPRTHLVRRGPSRAAAGSPRLVGRVLTPSAPRRARRPAAPSPTRRAAPSPTRRADPGRARGVVPSRPDRHAGARDRTRAASSLARRATRSSRPPHPALQTQGRRRKRRRPSGPRRPARPGGPSLVAGLSPVATVDRLDPRPAHRCRRNSSSRRSPGRHRTLRHHARHSSRSPAAAHSPAAVGARSRPATPAGRGRHEEHALIPRAAPRRREKVRCRLEAGRSPARSSRLRGETLSSRAGRSGPRAVPSPAAEPRRSHVGCSGPIPPGKRSRAAVGSRVRRRARPGRTPLVRSAPGPSSGNVRPAATTPVGTSLAPAPTGRTPRHRHPVSNADRTRSASQVAAVGVPSSVIRWTTPGG